MTYTQWFNEHSKKHKSILNLINPKTKDNIINYFTYENMRDNHNDFCLLYSTNTKCHDMQDLNCYMCGCPYFRFDDIGLEVSGNIVIYSKCIKNLGSKFVSKNAIHQDCSSCEVPHNIKFINDNFDIDWSKMMSGVASR